MQTQLIAAFICAALAGCAVAQTTGPQRTGPSSSASPYVTATAPGWNVTSIITVGTPNGVAQKNADNGYAMVGTPDGLGAYDNGDNTFTVLMNHELRANSGIARAHGSVGAFVSEWVISKTDFRVISGADLTRRLANGDSQHLVSTGAGTWAPANTVAGANNAFGRLCSADLPAVSAFYNAATGLGTQSRIFMNGEEQGTEGRAYGFVATGAAKGNTCELPELGKFSWENSVANPFSGDRTVVIGLDDASPGQVYVYSGMKTRTGNDVQRAGLDNGTLRGIKVDAANAQGGADANREVGQINGSFTTEAIDTAQSGALQQAESVAQKVTEFARPEDGHWADARTFYFVTTGATVSGVVNPSRLYRLRFAGGAGGAVDYEKGTVSMVLQADSLTGADGAVARNFDNIVVADNGEILIQEDPGDSAYIAKTWLFNPVTGTATQIMESDRSRFLPGAAAFLTQNEESSGVIEVTRVLGRNDGLRYFLGSMQAHYAIAGELAHGGQLYVMAAPEPSRAAVR